MQEIYAAALDDEAVIAGGMVVRDGRSQAIDRVAIFDQRRGRWREGPRLPDPRHHCALATVNRTLYAIGGARHGLPGEPAGDHWRQRTDVFVLAGAEWARGPSLPIAQSEGVVLAHGGHIHVLTGRTSGDPTATRWDEQRDTAFHQVLDTASGRRTFAAPAPAARNSATGGVIDGRLYVAGGRTMAGGNMARLDMYDPAADRWQALRPMPLAAGGLAGAVIDGALCVFGGEMLGRKDAGGVIARGWRYDPATDRWGALPDMRTPRHGLAAVALGNRILLIGGGILPATGHTVATVESLAPAPYRKEVPGGRHT